MTYERHLALPAQNEETFFLWGPRQTGKSSLLRALYPGAVYLDLLSSAELRRFTARPEDLEADVRGGGGRFVVIDEVQKVPALLDEVHRLHEEGFRFALCGSSARKVKRGHANLLGGRAIRFELMGLVYPEMGSDFELVRVINHGTLPRIFSSTHPKRYLKSYVGDYLKEEIRAEGLVRNLGAFDDFLRQAALSDTEPVNAATIARECGIAANSVRSYFQILEDTLLGRFLPAYTRRPKRRITKAPKFYFFDVGVVNQIARRSDLEPGTPSFGKAFENWIHHELVAYNSYSERGADLSYWRLTTGVEVDFIVEEMALAIEVKASERIRKEHLKNLRSLAEDHPRVGRRILVALVPRPHLTEDGIEVLPVETFLQQLWSGELF